MASYHFSVQVLKRSKGQSAVAASAYRSGTAIHDEWHNKIADYSRRGGVVYSEILLPAHADPRLTDRSTLWNLAENMEKRKDAQLAREINIALPHELTADQRKELLRTFVQEQFVRRGMVADVAIHAPQEAKNDHQKNHHAHIMLTLRQATATGLHDVKTREWNSRDLLEHWREQWSSIQNDYLARNGHKGRVDHRTLKEQHRDAVMQRDDHAAFALDRIPEIHVGKHGRHKNTSRTRSRDRYVRTRGNHERLRIYTVTDQGSRVDFNGSILKQNRDFTTSYSRDLQVKKARLMQERFNPNSLANLKRRTIMYEWEQMKLAYGDTPAPDRPLGYWRALEKLINMMPPEKRNGPFTMPNFDDHNLPQNQKQPLPFKPEPFDSKELREKMQQDVVDYFSLRKGLAKIGLIDDQIKSLSARIGLAMDLEALRNRRFFDFRARYQEKQHRNRERHNVLKFRRFRKSRGSTK